MNKSLKHICVVLHPYFIGFYVLNSLSYSDSILKLPLNKVQRKNILKTKLDLNAMTVVS